MRTGIAVGHIDDLAVPLAKENTENALFCVSSSAIIVVNNRE